MCIRDRVILIPFGIGVIYSFCGWRGTYFAGGDHFYDAFVGFQNYIKVFKSSKFRDSFVYTLEFTVVAVIALNIVSLIMALLATSVHKGAGAYRTIYFMPNLLGGLALGYIWQVIFEIVFSQLIFNKDGIINIPFFCNMLQDRYKAMIALAILVTWQMAGYMMLDVYKRQLLDFNYAAHPIPIEEVESVDLSLIHICCGPEPEYL